VKIKSDPCSDIRKLAEMQVLYYFIDEIIIVTYMSIRFYTVNLTRTDSRMKVSLKGLPDTLRGVAWPTSACVVR